MFLGEDAGAEPGHCGEPVATPADARAASGREVGSLLARAVAAGDPVTLARELSVALGDADFGSLDGRRLMDATLALEGLQRRLDATRAATIGRLDARDTTYAEVGLATRTWKANRTHGSPGVVARELRLAKTLQRFAAFERALASGVVSAEHVHALATASNPRVIDRLVEIQDSLVEFASRNRFNHYVAHLRNVVALLDEDGPQPDHGDTNTARMAADGTGNLHLVMDLTGTDAVTAQRIITEETDRQYRTAVRENEHSGLPIPDTQLLRARAITELLTRGAKANPASPKPAVEAIITLNADCDGRPTHVHSIDGESIDPTTAAVLLCDAHLQPVVTDTGGNPLNLGRTVRLFTPGQRRALAARDGGCIFPGCDQPIARCDAHHLRQWVHGGRTTCDNATNSKYVPCRARTRKGQSREHRQVQRAPSERPLTAPGMSASTLAPRAGPRPAPYLPRLCWFAPTGGPHRLAPLVPAALRGGRQRSLTRLRVLNTDAVAWRGGANGSVPTL